MRFSYLPLLCVVTSALAAPLNDLATRDVKVIEKALQNVMQSISKMQSAVNAFDKVRTGNLVEQERGIEIAGQDLVNIMDAGARDIRAGPNVDYLEAIGLLVPVESLTSAVQTCVNTWVAAKPHIIKAGGRDEVLRILRLQSIASDGLTDAMVSKMPELGKYVGRMYGSRVKSIIDYAITQFRA